MVVCAACGAENRDKAKFCKGCARPLAPLAAGPRALLAQAPEPMALCPACHAPNPAGSIRCTACRGSMDAASGLAGGAAEPPAGRRGRQGLVGGMALAALALLAGGWWLQRPAPAVPAVQLVMPAPVRAATMPAPSAEATFTPVGARQEPAAATPTPATAPDVPPVASAPVRPEPKAPAVRNRPPGERQRAAPEPAQPAGVAEATSARAEPALRPAAAVEPARATEPAVGVDQTCAGSSNFITRDICRLKACSDPARAGDPVCVRFRQMEEANRQRQRN